MKPSYATLKKSASSNRWLARQSSDPYVKQRFTSPNNGSNASAALGEQYRSRASHKLLELCQRFPKLLSRGSTVVDLGCAPGSWSQVAAERIGSRGLVVGVDLLPVRPFAESEEGRKLATIQMIQGDFLDPRVGDQVRAVLEASLPMARRRVQVDTVLSDMMSNTTGVRIRDIESSLELCGAALSFCKEILKTSKTLPNQADATGPAEKISKKVDPREDGYVDGPADEGPNTKSKSKESISQQRQSSRGGNLVLKHFAHPSANEFKNTHLVPRFQRIHVVKPPSSRSESSEAFWVCVGYKGEE